jgi:Sigma-70 region 2
VGETAGGDALTARVRQLYPSLRAFAAGVSSAEPDDVVQEAFVRLLQRGSLDSISDLGAYLRRVVVTVAIDRARRDRSARRARDRSGPPVAGLPAVYPSDVAELMALDVRSRALHRDWGTPGSRRGATIRRVRVGGSSARHGFQVVRSRTTAADDTGRGPASGSFTSGCPGRGGVVELGTFVDALQRLTAGELRDLAFDLDHAVDCAADEFALFKALADVDRAARRVQLVIQAGLAAHVSVGAVLFAARAAGFDLPNSDITRVARGASHVARALVASDTAEDLVVVTRGFHRIAA